MLLASAALLAAAIVFAAYRLGDKLQTTGSDRVEVNGGYALVQPFSKVFTVPVKKAVFLGGKAVIQSFEDECYVLDADKVVIVPTRADAELVRSGEAAEGPAGSPPRLASGDEAESDSTAHTPDLDG